ncbi:hypothetical protein C1H46_023940 [Malus baccata]|uniref:Uncharacterized protein n=1 Tax=Malus baccata TaxID=106549 RepID=A0A540LW67_MALBA|nr:hypothetical protein C1H46_023940 [Malus baccata]
MPTTAFVLSVATSFLSGLGFFAGVIFFHVPDMHGGSFARTSLTWQKLGEMTWGGNTTGKARFAGDIKHSKGHKSKNSSTGTIAEQSKDHKSHESTKVLDKWSSPQHLLDHQTKIRVYNFGEFWGK